MSHEPDANLLITLKNNLKQLTNNNNKSPNNPQNYLSITYSVSIILLSTFTNLF